MIYQLQAIMLENVVLASTLVSNALAHQLIVLIVLQSVHFSDHFQEQIHVLVYRDIMMMVLLLLVRNVTTVVWLAPWDQVLAHAVNVLMLLQTHTE